MAGRLHRRDFLRVGGGMFGLSMVDLLRLEASGTIPNRDAGKSAILLFLPGGQSHLDTWDMKPDNAEVRGEFRPIQTRLPGFQVCELMPQLARQTDKYAVLRNVAHTNAVHGPGQRYMRTGNRPLASLEYPDHGCVVSKELPSPRGIPPYVTLPIRASNGLIESAGYLGVAYRSFSVPGDPSSDRYSVRALDSSGSEPGRLRRRVDFLNRVDQGLRQADARSQDLEGMDHFYRQAYDVLSRRRFAEPSSCIVKARPCATATAGIASARPASWPGG